MRTTTCIGVGIDAFENKQQGVATDKLEDNLQGIPTEKSIENLARFT
jgi:hypothetical protein